MKKPAECAATGSAGDFLPARLSLPLLVAASRGCRGCELYCRGTQTVFGEGPAHAALMMVGEQPGDQEDLQGKPFVGPAGRVLDEALEAAGVSRAQTYVTNAVKHFKWEARGKRRIHAKPNAREMAACRPWLEAEIAVVKPKIIVCLGATASQSLLGSKFRLTQHRGEFQKTNWAAELLATIHPSSIVRMPDPAARHQARAEFIGDLKRVASRLKSLMKK